MALPSLSTPYLLNTWNINLVVPARTPGAYAILLPPSGERNALYVGRADEDLAQVLRDRSLSYGERHYFAYAPSTSAANAFQWECEMYHAWNPPHNEGHPTRPAGEDWKCPVCGA